MFYLLTLLVVVFIQLGNGLKFCDKFAENNYKISYGYRHMVSEADAYRQYVVIGHDLWSLKHTDSANDTIKTVSIDDQNSGHSDWFGADYSMAICLLFNGHESSEAPGDHGITGLMKTGSKDIEWALLNKDLKIIKRLNKTTVPYDMTATMAWVMNYEKTKPDYIHLRHVLLWDGFQITGRFFGDYKKPENNEDGDTRHQTLYNQMLSNRTVIAVLGQGVVGQKYDDSVIVLFQFDHQIKYCYANLSQDDHKMPEMCRPENLKTLIDCNSNSWYLILILLIILIVITIAVIIGIVSHMFQNRKTTQIEIEENKPKSITAAQRSAPITSTSVEPKPMRSNK